MTKWWISRTKDWTCFQSGPEVQQKAVELVFRMWMTHDRLSD